MSRTSSIASDATHGLRRGWTRNLMAAGALAVTSEAVAHWSEAFSDGIWPSADRTRLSALIIPVDLCSHYDSNGAGGRSLRCLQMSRLVSQAKPKRRQISRKIGR